MDQTTTHGLPVTQERKYNTTPDGRLVNRSTGVRIPDDEPVFILRAKDRNAIATLWDYLRHCRNADHCAVIKSRIQDFHAFAKANPERMKEPTSNVNELAHADIGRETPAAERTITLRELAFALNYHGHDAVIEAPDHVLAERYFEVVERNRGTHPSLGGA